MIALYIFCYLAIGILFVAALMKLGKGSTPTGGEPQDILFYAATWPIILPIVISAAIAAIVVFLAMFLYSIISNE